MNILLVGSCKGLNKQDQQLFANACRNIVRWTLPEHCLIFAGTLPPSADHYALEEFLLLADTPASKVDIRCVRLYSAASDSTQRAHRSGNNDTYKKLETLNTGTHDRNIILSSDSEYEKAFSEALDYAHAVVVLGGGEDTTKMLHLAEKKRRPVISFREFDYPQTHRHGCLSGHYSTFGMTQSQESFCYNSKLSGAGDEPQWKELLRTLSKYRTPRRTMWQCVGIASAAAMLPLLLLLLVSFLPSIPWAPLRVGTVGILWSMFASLFRLAITMFDDPPLSSSMREHIIRSCGIGFYHGATATAIVVFLASAVQSTTPIPVEKLQSLCLGIAIIFSLFDARTPSEMAASVKKVSSFFSN